MNFKEILIELLKSQEKVNDILAPDWRNNLSNSQIQLAIISECGELADSIGFEWWKQTNKDISNIRTETVDIAHFVFTLILKITDKNEINYKLIEDYVKIDKKAIQEYIDEGLSEYTIYSMLITDIINESMQVIIGGKPRIEFLLSKLFALVTYTFNELDDFIKEFLIKNALNIARSKLGYKDGTYQKVIDGKEDNLHMKQLMNKLDILDVDKMVDEYIKLYKKLLKKEVS